MDADRRRSRAIRRLARWTEQRDRNSGRSRSRWRVRFAYARWAAARRHVERIAVRDVLTVDPAVFAVPAGLADLTGSRAAAVDAAFAYYRHVVYGFASYPADHLAAGGVPGGTVHGEPPPAPLRRDRPGR